MGLPNRASRLKRRLAGAQRDSDCVQTQLAVYVSPGAAVQGVKFPDGAHHPVQVHFLGQGFEVSPQGRVPKQGRPGAAGQFKNVREETIKHFELDFKRFFAIF